ncbi:hypothetical protein LZ906_007740 [Paraclostridium ghonii]|nr:hypothetical protein [Paeniclostridium ghonii]
MNIYKTFLELTLEDCMELYKKKSWVFIYADGQFAGIEVERK